jgi:hypothetical protein
MEKFHEALESLDFDTKLLTRFQFSFIDINGHTWLHFAVLLLYLFFNNVVSRLQG